MDFRLAFWVCGLSSAAETLDKFWLVSIGGGLPSPFNWSLKGLGGLGFWIKVVVLRS